jgi:hypothetical protein
MNFETVGMPTLEIVETPRRFNPCVKSGLKPRLESNDFDIAAAA